MMYNVQNGTTTYNFYDPGSQRGANINNIITFNEAAAYLWQNVQGKDFDVETLTQLLLEEYDVTEDIAREDAQATIDDWKEIGIIR